ncbi:hypothetical protein KHQ82_04985 [Mycoplasmatota bacterium]|nr:hypothetical protein KHQ82_04985 [Mycoplasmatota bacterium]
MKIFYIGILMILLMLISGCDQNENTTDFLSNYDSTKYVSYTNDDGVFKVTLFIQEGPYYHDKHINIYSTLEYFGDKELVEIWHGIPYFSYAIFDEKDYYSEAITFTILKRTVLE